MQYKRGQFVGNHGLSYTITNLTMMAIWRSNSFRIHPLIAEKKTTLLFQGTFGHTVEKIFRASPSKSKIIEYFVALACKLGEFHIHNSLPQFI